MNVFDKIFDREELFSDNINDESYKNLVAQADKYIDLFADTLSDEAYDNIMQCLSIIEACNNIEKKYAFVQGFQFGDSIKKTL